MTDKTTQKPTNEDITIDVFAFRYALGRETGGAHVVIERIKSRWQFYPEQVRNQIQEDINGALKHGALGLYAHRWAEIMKLPLTDAPDEEPSVGPKP